MNDPRQYLVHLTNRGSKVLTDEDGGVGEFQCYTKQPMKDINKFGLIHYSIPKMLDSLDRKNRSFTIRMIYQKGQGAAGAEMDYHDIPVHMPLMDYYNMLTSQKFDLSMDQKVGVMVAPAGAIGNNANTLLGGTQNETPFSRLKNTLAFDEVLQVTINWAIQREWRKQYALPGHNNNHGNGMEHRINALSRLSCVVKMEQGKYALYFGYRGHDNNTLANTSFKDTGLSGQFDTGHSGQAWAAGASAASGMPCRVAAVANMVDVTATGSYPFVDTNGTTHLDHRVFAGVAANADELEHIVLKQVELHNLSPRMQMFLGATKATDGSDTQVGVNGDPRVTRGWVQLVNYTGIANDGAQRRLGLLKFQMALPPNLDPPSFLMLNLTAQGTRTKVLGHENEKGGWAIPTPPSLFRSKYDNQPFNRFYDSNMCRSMPVILSPATDALKYAAWQTNFAVGYAGTVASQRSGSGLGYNFDPIVRQALTATGGVLAIDNFSLTDSRHIIFGGIDEYPECLGRKYTRHNDGTRGGENSAGFGTGAFKQSAVFTVSMVEPNWIWCSVPDSTVQTLDVQLAWGDTSETVVCQAGNPVQFSIIASP